MKKLLITVYAGAAMAYGHSDWKPSFEEKKVVTEQEKKRIAEAMPKKPIVKPKKDRSVLLYSATAGARHWSIPIGKVAFEQMAEQSGAFEIVISDDPEHFKSENLKQFDVVILMNSTGNFFMPCTRGEDSIRDQFSDEEWEALKVRDAQLIGNLVKYVREGGGLVAIHAAADAYYGNRDYRNMIGGTFMGHPWHGNQKVTVRIDEPDHPLMKAAFEGNTQLSITEEIFQYNEPYSRDRLHVLMTLDVEKSEKPKGEMKRTDGDYALAWIREEGKGRVFYTGIGHNYEHYWNPQILKHYLAGIQYAAGDLEADATPSAEL
ncbi:ThuA domain-containing protein [Pontiella agarivorans]|uniref:ThuA domain-containing protein n=1 Tax=Pontiella agarivorans TaxID=3038953 RepID=A0ABU5MTJ5_9BACT|nr:ThuA domain-containing protein [Pontiella agarivorans]MDZ8117531.1 ThuA domain-containing protein [Pontiella agarivorans]